MCIGIIRNNFLVDERAPAGRVEPATERVTLYCTCRPSALTTRPRKQVLAEVVRLLFIGIETEYRLSIGRYSILFDTSEYRLLLDT